MCKRTRFFGFGVKKQCFFAHGPKNKANLVFWRSVSLKNIVCEQTKVEGVPTTIRGSAAVEERLARAHAKMTQKRKVTLQEIAEIEPWQWLLSEESKGRLDACKKQAIVDAGKKVTKIAPPASRTNRTGGAGSSSKAAKKKSEELATTLELWG